VIIGRTLIGAGLAFSVFGVYALLVLDNFYSRVVVTSKVETMGFLTVAIGAMVLAGWSTIALKIAVVAVFELITVPVGSHAIARSAYMNGFRVRRAITVRQRSGERDA